MMLACESIFSSTSLDARPLKIANIEIYIQHSCPVGQARYSFHLPFTYDLQILLAGGKHQCWALLMMLLAMIWPIQNDAQNLKNDWNPGIWVLIWEYLARAIQRIPTRQGLDGFQKSLCPCALDERSLSIIGRGIFKLICKRILAPDDT